LADIFISYSRNDSAQALALVEQLRTNGMDVWIDQHGIEGATSWSKEIANALQACHTMLLLLSPTAVTSKNVAKELSVAAQLNKRIVPVQVIRTPLEGEFLYHLSALQRVKIEDVESIVRAITGAALDRQVRHAPGPIDERKSLMILPFEDLSPTGDNGWFADGLSSELISALSKVQALHVADAQATKEFKLYRGQLTTYAREMNIRYFIQGDVRKFGDQIKITSRLLDIETGDHLWQDAMKGTMDDIFDIQEKVAREVVEGLKVHLDSDEHKQLTMRGTQNAEAYELYLRAYEYFMRYTKEHCEYAIRLIGLSLEIDPNFALAKLRRAVILVTYSLMYESRPDMVTEAERLLQEASQTITPQEDWRVLAIQAFVADAHGDKDHAEALRKENFQIAPNEYERLHSLMQHYLHSGRPLEVIPLVDTYLSLSPANYYIG
jgi:TolB-like protein